LDLLFTVDSLEAVQPLMELVPEAVVGVAGE
jgi:hypothetical protein